MNRTKKIKAIVIVLVLLLVGVLLVIFSDEKSEQEAARGSSEKQDVRTNQRTEIDRNDPQITPELIARHEAATKKMEQEAIQQIKNAFGTPINFWGKVVDENQNPVQGAEIRFGANDKYYETGSKYQSVSDENGLFSIANIKGRSLSVDVSKNGYYSPHETAQGQFRYYQPQYSQLPIPTKQSPAVFILKKKGETEPLIKYTKGSKIPASGASVGFDLKQGTVVPLAKADLIVSGYPNHKPTYQGKKDYPYPWGYEWGYQLKVAGGGLIEKEGGKYAFVAPENGYQETFKFDMPQSEHDEGWKSKDKRTFYVRLTNGNYAEINFRYVPGGDRFMVVNGLYNPSGSRNLEYDKSKQIK